MGVLGPPCPERGGAGGQRAGSGLLRSWGGGLVSGLRRLRQKPDGAGGEPRGEEREPLRRGQGAKDSSGPGPWRDQLGGEPDSGTQSLALGTIEPGLSRPLVAT